MKKEFYLKTDFMGSFEMEKPCRYIDNLDDVEIFLKKLRKIGYSALPNFCYVDFEDFKEVPFHKAKERIKEEGFEQIIIREEGGGLEILLKNKHSGSGRRGGPFSRGIAGYIKLFSPKEKDYYEIEELIDRTWPEK